MRRIALLLLVLAATSCGLCKHVPTETHVKDSTVVHYVDSTIYSIKDSAIFVQIPAEESSAVLPDGFRSHVQTSLAESDAWVEEGLLHHTIRNRSDALLPAVVPVTTVAHVVLDSSDHNALAQRVITKEMERKLTWWQRFRLGAFWWLIAFALVGWRRELWALMKKLIPGIA